MKFVICAVLATVFAVAHCDEETFAGIPISQLPDPENRPAMARFIVNNANYTSFGYISKQCGEPCGCPGNAFYATADGKMGCGTGVPYFWTTTHHPSTVEILQSPKGTLVVSLAQTDICRTRGWDPQDPRCAHITIRGNFVKLDAKDPEFAVGKEALFTRFPQFSYYPSGHTFFVAKMNITSISIINKFGGPAEIDLKEYFKIKC